MHVISETPERTVTTPAAVMAGLASPSQGSTEITTWVVRMGSAMGAPPHTIDKEQVWMPLKGSFAFVVDGDKADVGAGQALVVPAGVLRSFTAADDTEAVVSMAVGGRVQPAGSEDWMPIPWAQ